MLEQMAQCSYAFYSYVRGGIIERSDSSICFVWVYFVFSSWFFNSIIYA